VQWSKVCRSSGKVLRHRALQFVLADRHPHDSPEPDAPVDDLPTLIAERIRAAIAIASRSSPIPTPIASSSAKPTSSRLIIGQYNDVRFRSNPHPSHGRRNPFAAPSSQLSLKISAPPVSSSAVDPRIRESGQLTPPRIRPALGKENSTIIGHERHRHKRPRSHSVRSTTTRSKAKRLEPPRSARKLRRRGALRPRDALDVFCYQGGFALHLAPHCSSVTGVDSSRPALEMAEKNSALNGQISKRERN